jgi:hypothetical protein
MVLRSLPRPSPQALRFSCVEVSNGEFLSLVDSRGGVFPLPRPLFPVYRFVCAVICTELRSLGCLNPSSRVGH